MFYLLGNLFWSKAKAIIIFFTTANSFITLILTDLVRNSKRIFYISKKINKFFCKKPVKDSKINESQS